MPTHQIGDHVTFGNVDRVANADQLASALRFLRFGKLRGCIQSFHLNVWLPGGNPTLLRENPVCKIDLSFGKPTFSGMPIVDVLH